MENFNVKQEALKISDCNTLFRGKFCLVKTTKIHCQKWNFLS